MGLYDRYLAVRVARHDADPPARVALVITERDLLTPGAFDTLAAFLRWALDYGADRVCVYVSVLDPDVIPAIERSIGDLAAPAAIAVRGPDATQPADERIVVSIGHGGKQEFTTAVRQLANDVAAGRLEPEEITAEDIENHLVFPIEPDLVIKTGAERLSDFMIWQSVYSELYFTDVNWQNFRQRDYLRAVLDFKDRQRRFGR